VPLLLQRPFLQVPSLQLPWIFFLRSWLAQTSSKLECVTNPNGEHGQFKGRPDIFPSDLLFFKWFDSFLQCKISNVALQKFFSL
jgi:hypothetical protein